MKHTQNKNQTLKIFNKKANLWWFKIERFMVCNTIPKWVGEVGKMGGWWKLMICANFHFYYIFQWKFCGKFIQFHFSYSVNYVFIIFFWKIKKKNEYEKIIRWEIFMEIYEEFLVRNLITEQIRIFRELWWTIYMQWIMFYCLNLKDEETIKENVWRAHFGFFLSQKIVSNFVRKFKNL